MATGRPVIGAKIQRAREAAKLTRAQLSERTSYAVRTITAWENDDRHPRPTALARIAQATGRQVAWFYTDTAAGAEAA